MRPRRSPASISRSARRCALMLARGLSVRDIEDAIKDETGRLLLSKTAVAEIGKQLWEDYQAFKTRDLAEYDIAYLFIDGIAERIRPGQRREPILAAWGFTCDGRKVLLHLMAGSKEDAETVSAFFQDMRGRGLGDRLLVVSDGAPGVIKAIEVCFPRSTRQRCLAHRMRNLAAKVPEDLWPEFKARAAAAYQAPSRKIARELADGLSADHGTELVNATACFMDDFEACIAHLRLPITHRRATRTHKPPLRHGSDSRRRAASFMTSCLRVGTRTSAEPFGQKSHSGLRRCRRRQRHRSAPPCWSCSPPTPRCAGRRQRWISACGG
jgi:putative transposase